MFRAIFASRHAVVSHYSKIRPQEKLDVYQSLTAAITRKVADTVSMNISVLHMLTHK
jgi:hypothetical protein